MVKRVDDGHERCRTEAGHPSATHERCATGVRHLALDEVDSTNAEAMRRAAAGERGPLWITARRQTAGRGRGGRAWGTPDGNLAATLLFAPGAPVAALAGLSLVAGVAAWEAVAPHLADLGGLRLKWPNDLLLDGAKLSGCLIESTAFGADCVVAIGIGINVAIAPQVPGRAVTALAAHGVASDAPAVAAGLQRQLDQWIRVWNRGAGLAAVRAAWLERTIAAGAAIAVSTGGGLLTGTFAGIDPDGALLLATADGSNRRVTFGDVLVG